MDVGVLAIQQDETGKPALHAYGIMKGGRAAFCGGMAEYEKTDENGFVINHDIWAYNQAKEFFEEMMSGSITLLEPYASRLEPAYQAVLTQSTEKNGGELSDTLKEQIKAQIETELKLEQVNEYDPDLLKRIYILFQSATEAYAGPVRSSSRNTDTAWMETYLSWVSMDDSTWEYIRGENPVFDYQLAAGDDADDVVAHRIDRNLMESATGTHSAMFAFMAASFLLHAQKERYVLSPEIIQQMEELAKFLDQYKLDKSPTQQWKTGPVLK